MHRLFSFFPYPFRAVFVAVDSQFATVESLHQHSIADFVSSGSILFRLAFEYVPPPADPNAIGNFQRLFSQRTVRSLLRFTAATCEWWQSPFASASFDLQESLTGCYIY